jgi:hypothetical protein
MHGDKEGFIGKKWPMKAWEQMFSRSVDERFAGLLRARGWGRLCQQTGGIVADE